MNDHDEARMDDDGCPPPRKVVVLRSLYSQIPAAIAFDAETGRELWSYGFGRPAP